MNEHNDTPFRDVNRFQQLALLLTDIINQLIGFEHLFPKQEIPDILSDIINNELNILLLNYSFAYYGLKGQLVNQAQYNDAINGMKELMGWEKQEKKNELKAIYISGIGGRYLERGDVKKAIKILKEALVVDSENPMVLVKLVKAYVKKGELVSAEKYRQKGARFFLKYDIEKERNETKSIAKKEFEQYIKKFKNYSVIFKKFYTGKSYYNRIFNEDEGILIQLQSILKEVRRFLKGKETCIPEERIIESLDDVMNIFFDWLSIVSGMSYYILKYKFDIKNQKEEVIQAIANVLGYLDLDKIPSPVEIKNKIHNSPEILDKNEFLSNSDQANYGEIDIILDEWGIPAITDYENDERKNLLQKPNQIVIKDEKIKILFSYPLSTEVYLEYVNEGGFSRLDLWRCIYNGYKKIYDEEQEDAGNPGSVSERVLNRARSFGRYGIWGHYLSELWLEGIKYDSNRKLVVLRIGS